MMMDQPGAISPTLIGIASPTAQTDARLRLAERTAQPGVLINLTLSVSKLRASPALHVLGQQCGEVRIRATRQDFLFIIHKFVLAPRILYGRG
jgi:hypothetical protein